MGAETFGDVTGRRSVRRARVLLAARLKTDSGDVDARLRDLSRKGALIECKQKMSVGDEVVFARGSTVVPARVAWVGGDRLGLEFLRMIDESEVLIPVSRGPPPQPQRFRRPRVLSEDLTEQERQLAKVWAVSVGINV